MSHANLESPGTIPGLSVIYSRIFHNILDYRLRAQEVFAQRNQPDERDSNGKQSDQATF